MAKIILLTGLTLSLAVQITRQYAPNYRLERLHRKAKHGNPYVFGRVYRREPDGSQHPWSGASLIFGRKLTMMPEEDYGTSASNTLPADDKARIKNVVAKECYGTDNRGITATQVGTKACN